MDVIGVVELTPDLPADVAERLVTAVYLASRNGTVGICLNGISLASLDRWLDPVVRADRCQAHGVEYFDGNDKEELFRRLTGARFFVAASDDLRVALEFRGSTVMTVDQGLEFLSNELPASASVH